MMRRGGKFPAPSMTRTQNKTAFTMWLNGCSDEALAKADPQSLARSYGLLISDVTADIARQKRVRERVA